MKVAQRIDIYVDHEKDIRVRCPECGDFTVCMITHLSEFIDI